jgi:hypothetical protein
MRLYSFCAALCVKCRTEVHPKCVQPKLCSLNAINKAPRRGSHQLLGASHLKCHLLQYFSGRSRAWHHKKVSHSFDTAGVQIYLLPKEPLILIVIKNYFPGNLLWIHKSWCAVLANKFTHLIIREGFGAINCDKPFSNGQPNFRLCP